MIDWRSKWGIIAVVLVFGFLASALGVMIALPSSSPPPSDRTAEAKPSQDESLVQAQDILAKATDSGTCRTALQQLNVYLEHHPERKPAPLTDAQRRLLQDPKGYGLSADELAEVEDPNFTLLDAQHLDLCFLLRDAARALELDGLSQPEEAAAAFAWVMRQVRLVEDNENLLPPQFVLHRGWGSPAERGLVFAALLEQLGMSGCMVGAVDAKTGGMRGWGCAALVTLPDGKKDIVVFDPRHGLPLPGPAGDRRPELARAFQLALPVPVPETRQLATLADLRRQPDLLAQLDADPKHPSGITAELVHGAQLYPVAQLSALAPRMKVAQEQLSASQAGTVLATDPEALLDGWKQAAARQGEPTPEVVVWRAAVGVQRRFWPAEEGGTDKAQQAQAHLRVVYWSALPPRLMNLGGEPQRRIRMLYAGRFAEFYIAPHMPRDLLLRGQLDEAAQGLVRARDELRDLRGRAPSPVGLDQRLDRWADEVIAGQAALQRAEREAGRGGQDDLQAARAQLDRVWKAADEFVIPLIESRAAEVRAPDVSFELALCKHEQAERLQAAVDRLRQAGKAVPAEDAEAAKEGWNNAVTWWQSYVNEAATSPLPRKTDPRLAEPPPDVRTSARAAATILEARAQVALGRRDAAVNLLQAAPADLPEAEQVTRLYLLRQLRGPGHAKDDSHP